MRTTILSCTALLLFVGATSAQAQSRDRDRRIERMADRIAEAAERAAERATAMAERIARDIEAQFEDWDDEGRHGKRTWSADEMRIDTTFAFSKDGTVELSATSGDIIVTGWNRAEARVRAYTERGTLKSNFTSTRLAIESESVRGRTGETRYEVSVPQGVRVVLRGRSGDLTARNTLGPVDATTTSGDVVLTSLKGRVTVESVSGDVQVADLEGDLAATSVSGDVEVDGVRGDVRVESTGGDIVVENAESASVEATTVSGDVSYTGSINGRGRYEFHSHSGGVSLDIPARTSAQFSVETYSGDLESDFAVTLQPRSSLTRTEDDRGRRRRRLEFTLGSGDARVIAESFSGDVVIHKQ